MDRPWSLLDPPRDFAQLIAHQILPPRRHDTLPAPVPTRCTARNYGGDVVTVDGAVTWRSGLYLAFVADYPEWGEWVAWVHRDTCEPIEP